MSFFFFNTIYGCFKIFESGILGSEFYFFFKTRLLLNGKRVVSVERL